uniref:limulus clotting factor C n=1 Tax=Graptopsaltria nigrofuscata TaxID=93686 RepID=J7MF51_9HEMI|nr:serine protease like protein [Graptopsaltria nigrofuscata]
MRQVYTLCSAVIVMWSTVIHYTVAVCECGRSRSYLDGSDRRVVNGQESRPHEYPWMALIVRYDSRRVHQPICGGSVINNYYILTAGHCVLSHVKVQDLGVVLGVHDSLLLDYGKARIYTIAKIIIHPLYGEGFVGSFLYIENDVALFRLHKEIIFDYYVRPLCLPKQDKDFYHWSAIVTGWGQKARVGPSARYLKEAIVKVLSYRECIASAAGVAYEKVSSQTLCAADVGIDSCKGDSGGPLMVKVPGHFMIQIGIVSFGVGCAIPGYPGVYSKVSKHVDWIHRMTTNAKYCKKPAYRHEHRSNVSRRNVLNDCDNVH